MTNTSVSIATQEHIGFLKPRLRESDIRECEASLGISGSEGLQRSFNTSAFCWTGFYGKEPVLIFGVGALNLLSDYGAPWMLASDEIRKVSVALLRESRDYVQKMLDLYPVLMNYIDARQDTSIRWLRWCGFTVEPAHPWGILGLPFHPFWMRRR